MPCHAITTDPRLSSRAESAKRGICFFHWQEISPMNYDASVRCLLSLGRELAAPTQAAATKFDLENITVLAERLGRPERTYPSAHIAGTNGKGSTAMSFEYSARERVDFAVFEVYALTGKIFKSHGGYAFEISGMGAKFARE